MSTPMIGGAEKYLRDLLWNVDRRRFEIVIYTASHPELEDFLGVWQALDWHEPQGLKM